jgi:dihydrofolate reductase
VLTRQKTFVAANCQVVHSLSEALAFAQQQNEQEVFIIGGAEVYAMALPQAERLYLTEIDAELEGDTFFPFFDKTQFTEISRSHHPADDRHPFAFDFVVYTKK